MARRAEVNCSSWVLSVGYYGYCSTSTAHWIAGLFPWPTPLWILAVKLGLYDIQISGMVWEWCTQGEIRWWFVADTSVKKWFQSRGHMASPGTGEPHWCFWSPLLLRVWLSVVLQTVVVYRFFFQGSYYSITHSETVNPELCLSRREVICSFLVLVRINQWSQTQKPTQSRREIWICEWCFVWKIGSWGVCSQLAENRSHLKTLKLRWKMKLIWLKKMLDSDLRLPVQFLGYSPPKFSYHWYVWSVSKMPEFMDVNLL